MKQPLEYNPRQSIRRSVVILAVVIAVFCLFIVTVLFVPLLLDSSSSGVKVSLFHRSPLDDYLSGTVTEISLGADPSNGFRSVCQSEEEMDEAIDKLFKLKLAKRDETVEMTDAFVMDVQCGNAKQVSLFFSLDDHLRVESSTNTSEVSYFQGNTKAIQEYLTFLLSLMKGDSGDDSPLRAYQPERIVSAKIRQQFSAQAINTLGICTDPSLNRQFLDELEQLALIPTVDQQREISQSFCITFHDAVAPLEIRLGQGDNADYVTVTKNGITAYFLTSPEESSALIKHLTEQYEQYKQSSKESPLGRIPGQMISMYLQKGTADYSEEISSTALPRVIAMLCDLNLTEIDSEATRLKKGDYCLTGAGGATEMRVILRENRMYYSYRQNTTTAEGEWQTAWYSFPATEADELYALLDQEWSAADNRLQHLLVEEKPTRLSFHMQSSSQILLFDGGDVHDQESLNEIAELIRSHVQERSNGPFKADADPDELTLYLTFSRIDGASIYCEINQDRLSISQEYLGSHTESNYHGDPSTYRIDPEATAELLAYLENYLPGADIVIPDEVANFGNKAAIRYALTKLGLTLTERVDHLALVSDEFFQTKEALCLTSMQYDTPQQAPVLTMFGNYTLDTPLSAQEIAELHAEDRSDSKVVRFTEEELLTILSTCFAEMPMTAQTLHRALENSNYYRYLESTNSWYCFVSGSNTIPSPLATYLTESGELVVFLDSGGMAVLREVDGSYRFVAHRKIA